MIINQALSALEDWQLHNNAYVTHAIASLGVSNYQLQGGKNPQLEWFDPVARIMRKKRAKRSVPLRAARVFLELSAQGKIPGWVFSVLDVEAIELASD